MAKMVRLENNNNKIEYLEAGSLSVAIHVMRVDDLIHIATTTANSMAAHLTAIQIENNKPNVQVLRSAMLADVLEKLDDVNVSVFDFQIGDS